MKYEIRYSHTAIETADSIAAAKDSVRDSLLPSKAEPIWIKADGDIYCYATQEDADRDDDGSNAYAVICRAENKD